MQATGEEADGEEDLEVANRNLRAALDASQQEVFEVYHQVGHRRSQPSDSRMSRPVSMAVSAKSQRVNEQPASWQFATGHLWPALLRIHRSRVHAAAAQLTTASSAHECLQIEALERQADEVVLLESRAELAESERDALLEARTLNPR